MQLEQAIKLIESPMFSNTSRMDWADLGCGEGLFTNALSNLLVPGSTIYSVDKNIQKFKEAQAEGIIIKKIEADFTTDPINITNLEGILMANSLHFVLDKKGLIKNSRLYFKHEENFLIVEYDSDIPNPWVPYPISFQSLEELYGSLGYQSIKKIYEQPSRYNQANIYSAEVKRYL